MSIMTTVFVSWLHKYYGMAAMASVAVTVAMVDGCYDRNGSICLNGSKNLNDCHGYNCCKG